MLGRELTELDICTGVKARGQALTIQELTAFGQSANNKEALVRFILDETKPLEMRIDWIQKALNEQKPVHPIRVVFKATSPLLSLRDPNQTYFDRMQTQLTMLSVRLQQQQAEQQRQAELRKVRQAAQAQAAAAQAAEAQAAAQAQAQAGGAAAEVKREKSTNGSMTAGDLMSAALAVLDRVAANRPPAYTRILDAMQANDMPSVRELIKKAVPNSTDPSGNALEARFTPNVRFIDGVQTVDSTFIYTGQTAIFWALRHKSIEGLRLLIERGANVVNQDQEGYTPLHCAANESDAMCLALLLQRYEQGRFVLPDRLYQGKTAAQMLVERYRPDGQNESLVDMLTMLREAGAKCDAAYALLLQKERIPFLMAFLRRQPANDVFTDELLLKGSPESREAVLGHRENFQARKARLAQRERDRVWEAAAEAKAAADAAEIAALRAQLLGESGRLLDQLLASLPGLTVSTLPFAGVGGSEYVNAAAAAAAIGEHARAEGELRVSAAAAAIAAAAAGEESPAPEDGGWGGWRSDVEDEADAAYADSGRGQVHTPNSIEEADPERAARRAAAGWIDEADLVEAGAAAESKQQQQHQQINYNPQVIAGDYSPEMDVYYANQGNKELLLSDILTLQDDAQKIQLLKAVLHASDAPHAVRRVFIATPPRGLLSLLQQDPNQDILKKVQITLDGLVGPECDSRVINGEYSPEFDVHYADQVNKNRLLSDILALEDNVKKITLLKEVVHPSKPKKPHAVRRALTATPPRSLLESAASAFQDDPNKAILERAEQALEELLKHKNRILNIVQNCNQLLVKDRDGVLVTDQHGYYLVDTVQEKALLDQAILEAKEDKSIDINARNIHTGMTALLYAIDTGRLDLVTSLVEAGADLTITRLFGETALHHAVGVAKRFPKILTYLVEIIGKKPKPEQEKLFRAQANYRGREGDPEFVTPFGHASASGFKDAMVLLYRNDPETISEICFAIKYNHVEAVAHFIKETNEVLFNKMYQGRSLLAYATSEAMQALLLKQVYQAICDGTLKEEERQRLFGGLTLQFKRNVANYIRTLPQDSEVVEDKEAGISYTRLLPLRVLKLEQAALDPTTPLGEFFARKAVDETEEKDERFDVEYRRLFPLTPMTMREPIIDPKKPGFFSDPEPMGDDLEEEKEAKYNPSLFVGSVYYKAETSPEFYAREPLSVYDDKKELERLRVIRGFFKKPTENQQEAPASSMFAFEFFKPKDQRVAEEKEKERIASARPDAALQEEGPKPAPSATK